MTRYKFHVRTIIIGVLVGLLLALALVEVSAETLNQTTPAEITGTLWCENDVNRNASYDSVDGDTMLSGLPVALYNDANCDGVVDGEALMSQASGADGTYAFSNVAAACYIVQVDDSTLSQYRCYNAATASTRGVQLDEQYLQADVSFQFNVAKALAVDSIQTESQTGGIISPNVIGIAALGLALMTMPLLVMNRWSGNWD